jgi:DNA-binding transcriptional ArsR family regulator
MEARIREVAKKQAEICRVFGNTSRVLILWTLSEGEMSVSDIASAIDTSLQNASQHLRLMKDRRILSCRREGSTVYYRINQDDLLGGCRHLLRMRNEAFEEA